MTEDTVRAQAEELFELLELQGAGLMEAWVAFDANAEGTMRVAGKSMAGHSPSGLFLHMIRQGEHLKVARGRKWTGWRFARGTHGGTYVRDPQGTDPLPKGYS